MHSRSVRGSSAINTSFKSRCWPFSCYFETKSSPSPISSFFFLFSSFYPFFFKPFSKTGFWQISLPPVSTPDSTGQSAHTDVDVLTTPDDKINRFTQHSSWSPLWPLIHKLTPTKISNLHRMQLKSKLCSSGCRSTERDEAVPIKMLSQLSYF